VDDPFPKIRHPLCWRVAEKALASRYSGEEGYSIGSQAKTRHLDHLARVSHPVRVHAQANRSVRSPTRCVASDLHPKKEEINRLDVVVAEVGTSLGGTHADADAAAAAVAAVAVDDGDDDIAVPRAACNAAGLGNMVVVSNELGGNSSVRRGLEDGSHMDFPVGTIEGMTKLGNMVGNVVDLDMKEGGSHMHHHRQVAQEDPCPHVANGQHPRQARYAGYC